MFMIHSVEKGSATLRFKSKLMPDSGGNLSPSGDDFSLKIWFKK